MTLIITILNALQYLLQLCSAYLRSHEVSSFTIVIDTIIVNASIAWNQQDFSRAICHAVQTRGPIYKISNDLSSNYLKFIVKSTYVSDLQRANISLREKNQFTNLTVSKLLTDTSGRTSHVELASRPRQCRHSVTCGILNVFLLGRKFVFIKHWFCQSCYRPMHPKRGPLTWEPSNPFTWSVNEGSLESGGMIWSVTLVTHWSRAFVWPDYQGRNAIFGHVARLPVNTPAHQAMLRQVELSVGRPPDPSWKRPPGRPRTKWTDQLRRDNNDVLIATLWRQAIGRGHSRATLRSEPTTR